MEFAAIDFETTGEVLRGVRAVVDFARRVYPAGRYGIDADAPRLCYLRRPLVRLVPMANLKG